MSEQPMDKKTQLLCNIFKFLNIFIIPASLVHLFELPITTNVIGSIGLVIIITDTILIYFLFRKYQYKPRMRFSLKFFFTLSVLVFLFQFLINFLGYSVISIQSSIMEFALLFSYFALFVHAATIFYAHGFWLNPEVQEVHGVKIEKRTESNVGKDTKTWLIISISLNFILLGFGTIIDFTYFFARVKGMFMMGVFAAMLSLFFGLIFLGKTFQIMSSFQQLLKKSKIKTAAIISTFIIGLTISSISFIPLLGTPFYIRDAEREFDAAFNPVFGGDWEALIPDTVEDYFKKDHFQILDYFIGPRDVQCIQVNDILYFNGSESSYPVDQSISLYFDVFLPPNNGVGLPGENSTLIRIHGGGWTIGTKNSGNIGMMNRYFASQGYVVFDIEYGLNNVSDLFGNIPLKPKNVMGNFTIDDILRHIGNFTYYLEDHAGFFGANLDSVFVSGGSAGGQLTCATALSLASKNYTEFSDAFTIKGMIPFYPANNVSLDFALTSRSEWVNPVEMLNTTSPACLLFQGKQDGLIVQSQILQDAYHGFGRTDCAHIQFPFAGHGNDIYYPGFYNQIFLYYMERFLYLYH